MGTKRNHRSSLIVVLSLVLLMAITLTACSSGKTVEETKVSETVTTKEEVAEAEVAEVESEPTAEPTPEATAEPTAEPTPEPIVYEGIDMDSDLPCKEWVETFRGVIEEPKLILFNDETNKKVIIEENGKVEPEEGDKLALYIPDGIVIGSVICPLLEETYTDNGYNEFELGTWEYEIEVPIRVEFVTDLITMEYVMIPLVKE